VFSDNVSVVKTVFGVKSKYIGEPKWKLRDWGTLPRSNLVKI
jgi:hypothetical protein